MSGVHLFGLFYTQEAPEDFANLRTAAGVDPRDVYLRNAALCGASLAAVGVRFTLVTNAPKVVGERLALLGVDTLDVREHRFTLAVPAGIAFYSAHYKVELLAAFGTGAFGPRPGLIDLDTVARRAPAIPAGLCAYDISDQIFPAYGRARVTADLAAIAGRPLPDPRWYGGEFITGSSADFARLAARIAQCWPRYVAATGTLHHSGDEAVVSAALNLLAADGEPIADAGAAGCIARWWSVRTLQPLPLLSTLHDRAILHLPADKTFLAAESARAFDADAFWDRYRTHARRRRVLQRVAAWRDRLRGRPRALPRL